MSGEELEGFLETLPAGPETVSELLDFLEDELFEGECNHSLQHSMKFMMGRNLNFPKFTSWLSNNGGYCDCKVMEQIAPIWKREHYESGAAWIGQPARSGPEGAE